MAKVTYQTESLRDLAKDPATTDLIREHWEQSAVHKEAIPLDIDWRGLALAEDAGALKIVTARRDGQFLGYMMWWLFPHPNARSTERAIQGSWNMISLLRPSIGMLRKMGVKHVIAHQKLHIDRAETIRALYRRVGFVEIDVVMSRVI